MVNLGDEVRDSVSGFTGIAVASHEYLHGCRRISVQPKADKGELPEFKTFDEPQLIVTKPKKVPKGSKKTGGPEKYSPTAKLTDNR